MEKKSKTLELMEKYRGIPIAKRFDEYTKEELEVLPPVPEYLINRKYEFYDVPPIYWSGYSWESLSE